MPEPRKKEGEKRCPDQMSYPDLYRFDGLCITSSKYQWESNIEISSNRTFDQFAIINAPRESGLNQ
jgi:hypothetical protein